MTTKKQAILLIHGIGEQRPMDTLRGFVRQAWTFNLGAQRKGFDVDALWSKPYPLSQDFELRRLTTPTNLADVRTDFYVVVGHSLGSVIGYDILNHAWAQWNAQVGQPSRVA